MAGTRDLALVWGVGVFGGGWVKKRHNKMSCVNWLEGLWVGYMAPGKKRE
jgi:hypothetical protein